MLATVALSIQAQRYLLHFNLAWSSQYRALFVTEGCQPFGNRADQRIKGRMQFLRAAVAAQCLGQTVGECAVSRLAWISTGMYGPR